MNTKSLLVLVDENLSLTYELVDSYLKYNNIKYKIDKYPTKINLDEYKEVLYVTVSISEYKYQYVARRLNVLNTIDNPQFLTINPSNKNMKRLTKIPKNTTEIVVEQLYKRFAKKLNISKQNIVHITGVPGAGKTSLIHILQKLYKDKTFVHLDKMDIKKLKNIIKTNKNIIIEGVPFKLSIDKLINKKIQITTSKEILKRNMSHRFVQELLQNNIFSTHSIPYLQNKLPEIDKIKNNYIRMSFNEVLVYMINLLK